MGVGVEWVWWVEAGLRLGVSGVAGGGTTSTNGRDSNLEGTEGGEGETT